MSFDWQWLLWSLALGFGLGWVASRIDVRQWQREQRESRRIYDQGLNLLLNDQHDKAIDTFIEVVQQDPDTVELHFALGNLFRRRGELERAVRVHEYLLQRPHLSQADRHRAQLALAKDFMSGGLFDRAEAAWKALAGTPFDTEAHVALLTLNERSRQWAQAAELAQWLQGHGDGAYDQRIAHHHCELHLEALAREDGPAAAAALSRAREAAPQAPRPLLLAGLQALREQAAPQALALWSPLAHQGAEAFALVAKEFVDAAQACAQEASASAVLQAYHVQQPSLAVLQALQRLDPAGHLARLREMLNQQNSLRLAQALLDAHTSAAETAVAASSPSSSQSGASEGQDLERVSRTLADAARVQARYRCAACGFEAQRHFWQCPGCLNWDTYPARCIDEL
jgi:lipopolysaccharide biosynthesis regulator YciM